MTVSYRDIKTVFHLAIYTALSQMSEYIMYGLSRMSEYITYGLSRMII